jgi:predicted DNA-binding ribbon-helix-helix protein
MSLPPEADQGGGKIVKHSLTIAGHRTSISLESIFWDKLKKIAEVRGQSVASLVGAIDAARGNVNLSSAIRVFVLEDAVRRIDHL